MKVLTLLRELGYSAKLVSFACYDIDQDSRTHYLLPKEAYSLVLAPLQHPVDLRNYAEWGGLNWWYSFEVEKGIE